MKTLVASLTFLISALVASAEVAAPTSAPTATAKSAPAPGPAKTSIATELQELIGTINAKLKAGVRTEEALAPDFKRFDAIVAAHKGEDAEQLAQVLYTKAMLYIQVLREYSKGAATLTQLKTDYPRSTQAVQVNDILVELQKYQEVEQRQAALKIGAIFPDFSEKDVNGAPLSISQFKGKVVLVDFWATWCGPCVQELPNVLAAYQKYHPKGFEIIGISLDEKEFTLKSFIKNAGVPWPQYFDGKGWGNKIATQHGITSIPATYLLDRSGRIIARDLRGPDLGKALAGLLK